MKIRKTAGAVGAEITEIRLDQLSPEEIGNLKGAFLEHGVLFFHDQALGPDAYLDFAQHMGEPIHYPFVRGLPGHPKIIEVKKLEHERVNFGGVWHSDTTYLTEPPKATMLLAREIPPFGGDTMFASQYAAYEALSEPMKRMLTGLTGVSSSAKADVSATREDRIKEDGASDAATVYLAEHPVVRTHPETGRKSLYVNEAHTVAIKELPSAESEALLRFLFAHQVRPEFTCRFSWQPGSMAYWDNRCVLHNPVNDYHGYRRLMHRITLRGDTPR